MSLETIKTALEGVRDETVAGANTANRVGTPLVDLVSNAITRRDDLIDAKSKTDLITVTQAIDLDNIGNGSFTKYSVDENNTPFTIPSWESVIEVHNDVGDIEVILPEATADDEGKEIKFWVEHNTANHKLIVKAPDATTLINNISADGADLAKAEFSSNQPNFFRITCQAMETDGVYIDNASSVYNALRYVVNFTTLWTFSPYSYLEASGVPTNFMTSNASWTMAVKLQGNMRASSDGQAFFMTPSYGFGLRGNGTYFMTSSTSGYLQTISPLTIPEQGEWIIYTYDHVNDQYTAWINGVKVLDATTSGTTPPSSAPTNLIFGSEEPNTGWSAPSGYLYPLQSPASFSNISVYSGLFTDADASLLTSATFATDGLSYSGSVSLTNQWVPADGDVMTTVTGAINLSLVGTNINTAEL